MIDPRMLSQRAYDAAQRGTDRRALDLIEAVERINQASYRLAVSTAAETHRVFEYPAPNPLNFEGATA